MGRMVYARVTLADVFGLWVAKALAGDIDWSCAVKKRLTALRSLSLALERPLAHMGLSIFRVIK